MLWLLQLACTTIQCKLVMAFCAHSIRQLAAQSAAPLASEHKSKPKSYFILLDFSLELLTQSNMLYTFDFALRGVGERRVRGLICLKMLIPYPSLFISVNCLHLLNKQYLIKIKKRFQLRLPFRRRERGCRLSRRMEWAQSESRSFQCIVNQTSCVIQTIERSVEKVSIAITETVPLPAKTCSPVL